MRLTLPDALMMLYCFAIDLSISVTEKLLGNVSHSSVVRFFKRIRTLISIKMDSIIFHGRTDGVCQITEIDESLFGRKRKHNKGRYAPRKWVFGMVQRDTRKSFFTAVNDRKAETLIPLIKAKVPEDTMIYSDDWSAYKNLKTHGYDHKVVVHANEFVSVEGVCTNTIEGIFPCLSHKSACL